MLRRDNKSYFISKIEILQKIFGLEIYLNCTIWGCSKTSYDIPLEGCIKALDYTFKPFWIADFWVFFKKIWFGSSSPTQFWPDQDPHNTCHDSASIRMNWICYRKAVFRICINLIRIQSGSRVCWPKFERFSAEKESPFFESKTTIYLSLGLRKGFRKYRRSLQPSKENIQHFKTWNFLIFFILL